MKMDIALFIKNDISKTIEAKDLSRNQYYAGYRGYLYCPENDCEAKLSFVERKNNTKYFRTFPSTDHRDGCPNAVKYDDLKGKYLLYDKRKNISNEHINEALERAFNKFIISSNIDLGYNRGIKKRNTKNDSNLGNSGIAELFNEGINNISGREPYIITRLYNQITKADDNETRCIIGYISSMQLLKNHGYINLTPKIENSVKVHFAEYFVANNKNEFDKMNILESYINLMKTKKKGIICCCIGRVKFLDKGINILPDRYNGFTIEGLKFYEIVKFMYNHRIGNV